MEDDSDSRELIVFLLERAGAQVRTACTTAEAIRILQVQLPDVLVSDIGLPEEDGYALRRSVAALWGERAPRSIALTAWAASSDRQKALDAGFDEHLAKPIDIERLLTVMAKLSSK